MLKINMKPLNKVLKKMCKLVSVDYNKINFKKNGWFLKHSWNEKQRDEFRKWMISYLMNDVEARNEIMKYHVKNKRMVEQTVDWFLFDYGWKNES